MSSDSSGLKSGWEMRRTPTKQRQKITLKRLRVKGRGESDYRGYVAEGSIVIFCFEMG